MNLAAWFTTIADTVLEWFAAVANTLPYGPWVAGLLFLVVPMLTARLLRRLDRSPPAEPAQGPDRAAR